MSQRTRWLTFLAALAVGLACVPLRGGDPLRAREPEPVAAAAESVRDTGNLTTIQGSVPASTGPYASYLAPLVALYRLAPTYQAYSVPVSGGRYRLRAPAGVYAVVGTSWRSTTAGAKAVPHVSIVIGRAGGVSTARASAAEDALPRPVGRGVSVGRIDLLGRGNVGSDVEAALAAATSSSPCSGFTVPDSKYGQYGAIAKALSTGADAATRPADRQSLRDALAMLRAWAADYRLFGDVTRADDLDSGRAAGTFRLVSLTPNQKQVWSASLSVSKGGYRALRGLVVEQVKRFVCGFPDSIRISVRHSEVIGFATVSWQAAWDLDFARVQASPGGGAAATYHAVSSRVTSWDATYGGECTGHGSWNGGAALTMVGVATLYDQADSRSYFYSVRWTGPPVPMSVSCNGKPVDTTGNRAAGDFGTRRLPYQRFPISGANDVPRAEWTVTDTSASD